MSEFPKTLELGHGGFLLPSGWPPATAIGEVYGVGSLGDNCKEESLGEEIVKRYNAFPDALEALRACVNAFEWQQADDDGETVGICMAVLESRRKAWACARAWLDELEMREAPFNG